MQVLMQSLVMQVQVHLSSLTASGDAVVQGDLTVSGNVTTTLSETVNIEDNTIVLNSNETGAPTQNGGIEVNRGTSDSASFFGTKLQITGK